MTISRSPSLRQALTGAASKLAWCELFESALTPARRVIATCNGVVFRDCALTGAMTTLNGVVTQLGITSGTTTSLAADLSVGTSTLRVEGGGHWISGSLGLDGSGCDFTVSTNPTATNGFALSAVSINAPVILPLGSSDITPPVVSITTSASNVTTSGSLALTATVSDNVGIARVDFLRNGALLASLTSPPWQASDTLYYGLNGTQAYTARAYDGAGNNTVSTAQSVTVNIPAPVESGTAVAVGAAITTAVLQNTLATTSTDVPITFGQVFKLGDLPSAGASVELKRSDSTVIPAQLDVKTTWPDGSVCHAVISALVPSMTASESIPVSIVRKTFAAGATPPTADSFVAAGMEAYVSIVDGGVAYGATLSSLISSAAMTPWLTGPIANEWLMHGPLKTAAGAEHPYIHTRFHVRAFTGTAKAKIDVTLENSWVIPNPAAVSGDNVWVNNSPTDATYDVTITVPGETTYSASAMVHYNRTRWIKTLWWNGTPTLHIKHNVAYLIASKAVPNYDQSVVPLASKIASNKTAFLSKSAPMQAGLTMPGMGSTGGRPDIGLNPGWCVLYLLSQDKDAKDTMIGTSMLSTSFPVCYRNKGTDKPVSILDYPSACLNISSSSDDLNKATNKHEKIPSRIGGVSCPNVPNDAHEPNLNFMSYLVTGDYVHLENMQFWNEWNVLQQTPAYRGFATGYVKQQQVRGLGWLMRTLAETAWVSPDGDPIKARTTAALDANLTYFVAQHVTGTDPAIANALGFMHHPTGGYNALLYPKNLDFNTKIIGISPWQDDFVTSSFGRIAELGYAKARTFLNWKVKFPIGRMLDPSYCWVQGTVYSLDMRDSSTSPLYTTFGQVYQSTIDPRIKATACNSQAMADANTVVYGDYGAYVIGQMPKYSGNSDGYPANMQPALAYAAMSDHPQGADAWLVFNSRSVKAAYTDNPAFAIVPR